MWSDIRLPRLFSILFLFLLPFGIGTPAFGNSLPPTARIDMDPQRPSNLVYEGETIFFDGSASWDADGGSIVLYERWINGVYHAGGSTMSYQFTLGSTNQTVKLRVKDDEGDWGEKTITLTVTTRPKRYYYLKDHLGSVRVTFNENGDVVHYDDYYPFGLQMPGRSMEEDGPKERFTGHEKDGETGLYYAGARFLDPVIGRWLSVDPLADSYEEWSAYNYALNNPLLLGDPTGNCPVGVGHGEQWSYTDDDGETVTLLCYNEGKDEGVSVEGADESAGYVRVEVPEESYGRGTPGDRTGYYYFRDADGNPYQLYDATRPTIVTGMPPPVGLKGIQLPRGLPSVVRSFARLKPSGFFGRNAQRLKSLRKSRLGRLLGTRVRVYQSELSGGAGGAREFFRQLTGRVPTKAVDSQPVGTLTVTFRRSTTGTGGGNFTVEIVDRASGVIEKIRFK